MSNVMQVFIQAKLSIGFKKELIGFMYFVLL